MIGIHASVDGLDETVKHLGDIGDRAQHPGPALEEMRKSFYAFEKRRFETNAWGSWAPDAAATSREKAKRGQDLRTERATGGLFRSLTSAGAPQAIWRPSTDSAVIGTGAKSAQWQQKGRGGEHREVVHVSKGERRAWARILAKWIVRGDV